MLGWEFPPYISGGLGTACFGLTRGMDRLGVAVTFVLPRPVTAEGSHVRIVSGPSGKPRAAPPAAEGELVEGTGVRVRPVDARLSPYARPADPNDPLGVAMRSGAVPTAEFTGGEGQTVVRGPSVLGEQPYGGDLFAEVERYAHAAAGIAGEEAFDVIHAHDWMTYPAGIAAAHASGRPLVIHVHSTEFDRSGLNVNQRIYDTERAGMHAAERIIAVSHLTKNIITQHYGVDGRKVEVVYNAIDDNGEAGTLRMAPISKDDKIVLFLGRITMQKGPEYFLAAAKKVLEVMDNVRFVMAGSGDMARRMIELAAEMGIGQRVLFTGFLRGDDVRKVFRMADLYVMPSVSEPFGIAPLEALANQVPVLISKQSGVAEVLKHALKVDFWDVNEMANKILAVLRHPPLQQTLRDHGTIEVSRFSWTDSAARCVEVYKQALAARGA
jgi:glycosyltransferase involved in cell wall biosynthesis